jgi:hypothetical protein
VNWLGLAAARIPNREQKDRKQEEEEQSCSPLLQDQWARRGFFANHLGEWEALRCEMQIGAMSRRLGVSKAELEGRQKL